MSGKTYLPFLIDPQRLIVLHSDTIFQASFSSTLTFLRHDSIHPQTSLELTSRIIPISRLPLLRTATFLVPSFIVCRLSLRQLSFSAADFSTRRLLRMFSSYGQYSWI